jgi:hypothetical protein
MPDAIKSQWLERSYKEYVTKWLLRRWRRVEDWPRALPEFVLWYSVAGNARRGGDAGGDDCLRVVRKRGPRVLSSQARSTWTHALQLSEELAAKHAGNPVDWFTGRCRSLERGWKRLDDIIWIGPKIASFILRDLSLIRDYSDGAGGTAVVYRRSIDRTWFARLSAKDQALFMPIDRYVHGFAKKHLASAVCAKYSFQDIQWDAELHRRAGTEIVRWARERSFDPRDLNIYWFSLGAENINKNGTPTK